MKVEIGELPYEDGNEEPKIEIHDYDMWNLDITVAILILPLLKKFREDCSNHGTPSIFFKEHELAYSEARSAAQVEQINRKANLEWQRVIDEMIWAFDKVLEGDIYSDEDTARIKQGLHLFAEHLHSLWT